MHLAGRKWLGAVPLFDPSKGQVVREAPGSGPGYWAGACSAMYDEETGKFYLYYRLRKPREFGRGFVCRIAESADGIRFEDIWSATREQLNTSSMERACLLKSPEDTWRLYISYVDPADNRWRIDVMQADTPAGFRTEEMSKVLTAADAGVEGVKDPYVLVIGRVYYMLISYAAVTRAGESHSDQEKHGTADVYNTGLVTSRTGLATSIDGVNFDWKGEVFGVGSGWDAYETRITCVLYNPPVFNAFYDGTENVEGNYEERTGLAQSLDLRSWERITPEGPRLVSPRASGALRYIDAVPMSDRILFYYEMARPDGAHDLMVSVI